MLHGDTVPAKELKRELPWHRHAMHLAVNGYTNVEIAGAVGKEPHQVSNVLRQEWMRPRMVEEIKKNANDEIKTLLERAAPGVLKRVISLAENTQDPDVLLRSSKDILDRYLGRATLPIVTTVTDVKKASDEELERIIATGGGGTPPEENGAEKPDGMG